MWKQIGGSERGGTGEHVRCTERSRPQLVLQYNGVGPYVHLWRATEARRTRVERRILYMLPAFNTRVIPGTRLDGQSEAWVTSQGGAQKCLGLGLTASW